MTAQVTKPYSMARAILGQDFISPEDVMKSCERRLHRRPTRAVLGHHALAGGAAVMPRKRVHARRRSQSPPVAPWGP